MKYSISVENVSIQFKEYRNFSLRKGSIDSPHRRKQFTALRDISFSVGHGQILGVIGSNGSGKSTLLRTISGILIPDTGKIDTYGQTVTLLALGAGFQTDLSGRENIILSGLLNGMSRKQIEQRMDEIIDFSELEEFIDKPVRTYSSGMHSKLSFSIASIFPSDVLLIDEILSVGDIRFRRKSYEKMLEIIRTEGRTVVLVSHNLRMIRSLCHQVAWLEKGILKDFGDTRKIILNYMQAEDAQNEDND